MSRTDHTGHWRTQRADELVGRRGWSRGRPLLLALAALALGGSSLLACGATVRQGFDPDEDGNGDDSFAGGDAGLTTCTPDPANFDIPGNDCDDDGDGEVDNTPTCDGALAEKGNAEDFAQALGLCQVATGKSFGLVSAKFTKGYKSSASGRSDQHGILKKFGDVIRPREGKQLGVLSTGYAEEYNGKSGEPFGGIIDFVDGYYGRDWNSTGTLPDGFPKAAEGCKQDDETHDVIDVVLELKAPKNAGGFTFDFDFFSSEWPTYICSEFNDGFLAYLTSKAGEANVSFDQNQNPVSVNNGFFDRCTDGVDVGCAQDPDTGEQFATPGISSCPGGPDELAGTGFGIEEQWCKIYEAGNDTSTGGGATGWLTSQAAIEPGETFTMEFIIWDTGDGRFDSSVLLDNFRWVQSAGPPATERPR